MSIADIIILLIVIAIMAFAIRKAVAHFKGDALCCGGSRDTSKPGKKFLDGPVMGTKIIRIDGMHCEHCVDSVTKALNAIEGVVAEVDLQKGTATVSYDRTISEGDLRTAIKNAGFTCLSIS